MPAAEHLNPLQMQLFVDPEEHIANLRGSIDFRPNEETWSGLWSRKLGEAKADPEEEPWTHGSGVHQSMEEQGMWWENAPRVIAASDESGWIQGEGHHRMAAAAEIQRQTGKNFWMPIDYGKSSYPANRRTET